MGGLNLEKGNVARKIALISGNNEVSLLDEAPAENELQMQELLKETPDLLPVDDFELTGPLMVVGRETTLASGAIDLVLLAPSGELVIVEFKTGPQNADFRSAVAQLLDYGAAIWGLSYDEFEAAVARRYFQAPHCTDLSLRGKQTIQEAAVAFWGEQRLAEGEPLATSLAEKLTRGDFHYVLVAQRFTDTMRRTLDYMSSFGGARFYGVELVRFQSPLASAFESRTVVRPSTGPSPRTRLVDEAIFLERIADEEYRRSLEELFDACRGFGLRFEWGSQGTSIRVMVPDRKEPLSVAWVFPPGAAGWMGIRDIAFGYNTASAQSAASVHEALDSYVRTIGGLPGVSPIEAKALSGYRFKPRAFVTLQQQLLEALAELVEEIGQLG